MIRRLRLKTVLAAFAVLAGCASTGLAEPIYTFTAVVSSTYITGSGSLPFGVGATVTGSVTYDQTAAFAYNSNGNYVYYPASVAINLVVNGTYSYSQSPGAGYYSTMAPSGQQVVLNTSVAGADPDLLSAGVESYRTSGNTEYDANTSANFSGLDGFLSGTTLNGLTVDPNLFDPTSAYSYVSGERDTENISQGGFSAYASFEARVLTFSATNITPTSVPEPASLAMMGIGLAGAGFYAWRRRRRAVA